MPKGNPTTLLTPVGRLVAGHPLKKRPKLDQNGKPVLDEKGVQVMSMFMAIAFPKNDFSTLIWPSMAAEIATGYPGGMPAGFSAKYKDGDSNDRKGIPYSKREGYAGCYVLNITSELDNLPPVVRLQGGNYVNLTVDEIKTGDYVRVALSMVVNIPTNPTHTPGLYVNHQLVEFLGYGVAINNGPDPMALLGGTAVALPPGASATPLAPVNVALPAGMGAAAPLALPGPVATAPAVAQPLAMPAAAPALQPSPAIVSPISPAHDFVAAAPAIAPVAPAPVAAAPVAAINGIAIAGYDAATGKPWGMVNGVATFLQ